MLDETIDPSYDVPVKVSKSTFDLQPVSSQSSTTMPPTLAQVQSLYTATRAASSRFASYNFKSYFVRRTDEHFAAPLASLGDTSTIKSGPVEKLDNAALDEFFDSATKELAVIERSAILNAMYSGERLVVESEASRHRE